MLIDDAPGLEAKVLGHGAFAVYPGHPITLGLLIMEEFASLEDAHATGGSFARALESQRIPGTGSSVSSALHYLSKISTGELTAEQAVDHARVGWRAVRSEDLPDALEPGQEQADQLAETYIAKAREWLGLGQDANPSIR